MGLDIKVMKILEPECLSHDNVYDDITRGYELLSDAIILYDTNSKIFKKFGKYTYKCKQLYLDIEKIYKEKFGNLDNFGYLQGWDYLVLTNISDMGDEEDVWDLVAAEDHIEKFPDRMIKVFIKDIPTYEQIEYVLLCDEIGYQRKGANSLFYKEVWGKEDDDIILVSDLKKLQEYRKKYFSHNCNLYNNEFGYCTEMYQTDAQMYKNFTTNIYNVFKKESKDNDKIFVAFV